MKGEYDFSKGVRGAVIPPQPGTTRVTLRIDDEVLDWFREQVHAAGGGDYSRLIDAALCDRITGAERLEEMLRRVVREEIEAAKRRRAPPAAGEA